MMNEGKLIAAIDLLNAILLFWTNIRYGVKYNEVDFSRY